MARRKMINKLIPLSEIKEELKLIDGSLTDYITLSGRIYKDYGNNLLYPKKNTINKANGYLYCGITMANGKQKQFRVHVLVAKAFISNPNNYPCVCHKDDNKQNCHKDNLEWGTVSKNTKDAYLRGLAKNDKGFDDSQSMPVCVFDLDYNLIKEYGSVTIASNDMGITKGGILYQCKHNLKTKPRKGYYFRFKKEYDEHGFIL